ncbi:MAG TPA: tRNA (adenosine(37)-N6)-threonylcarbamoyltransferase complex transferase subunit TsaD [Bacteroidota bacterium]
MTVLGIETSCDETSAAVVKDGRLLSNITKTQLFHGDFGGVVPELASRAHLRLIVPIVGKALEAAGLEKTDLNVVAAVYGPGLIGSILVGLGFGKSMAVGLGIPFVGINHMEAHIVSNLIEDPKPAFPFVNLTVSGGHTQLVLVNGPLEYRLLGETRDDAAGEAFDKVAKMFGIGYPGGPMIDRLAAEGNPNAVAFPRPYLDEDGFEFSFSGLKTSILYYLRKNNLTAEGLASNKNILSDLCASFQAAVVDVLVAKLMNAAEKFGVRSVAVAGGVAANSGLRSRLGKECTKRDLSLFIPKPEYCTDNGAMIAMAGYLKAHQGKYSDLELAAAPNLELSSIP